MKCLTRAPIDSYHKINIHPAFSIVIPMYHLRFFHGFITDLKAEINPSNHNKNNHFTVNYWMALFACHCINLCFEWQTNQDFQTNYITDKLKFSNKYYSRINYKHIAKLIAPTSPSPPKIDANVSNYHTMRLFTSILVPLLLSTLPRPIYRLLVCHRQMIAKTAPKPQSAFSHCYPSGWYGLKTNHAQASLRSAP